MSNVQFWNGSTWVNFYTLPNATSSTLGGVKIGNNITVSSGTISLTKSNVTSALGYTPLSLSGGAMTGAISYKGTKATYSMIKWIDNTADTYGNGIRIGGGGATIIGGGESAELPSVNGGEEILYLMNDGNIDFYSNCQGGLNSAKHMSFDTSGNLNVPDVRASGNIYEGGTLLSSKYAAVSHNHDNIYLGKTTYEWNKEFAAGSNGAVSLGRYKLYDTQLAFDITTTTAITLSGKLVIAAQNGNILKATVYGDASNTLVNYLTIYQSAKTNNTSWIEIFCNFPSWSKNKVHIYGVSLNSATVTRQMASVTFTNGVPSGVTSGDTKWTGTIVNDITTYCAAANHNHNSSYLPLSGGTIDGFLTITQKTDGTPLSLYYNNENDYFLKVYPDPNDYTNIYMIDVNDSAAGEVALHLPSKSGTFALTSDIPTALKNPNVLKFGSKTYDGSSTQTITLSDLGGGGGGMACTQVFEGAGERQGSYWLNGKTTTISANNYKMLIFEINVNDVNFYLSVPTNFIVSGSTYFYLAAGNTNNGAMGIVQVMANNTSFKVSVSNGNITVWNVNVYAYK